MNVKKEDIKMKRTMKNYSPEFKAKVVLELLQENKTRKCSHLSRSI
jgi:transposase-like protein